MIMTTPQRPIQHFLVCWAHGFRKPIQKLGHQSHFQLKFCFFETLEGRSKTRLEQAAQLTLSELELESVNLLILLHDEVLVPCYYLVM